MQIDVMVLSYLIVAHCIMDFFCQTDWMAKNKSKKFEALSIHVAVYSIPFFYFGFKYGIINMVLHALIDAITSRITGKFYKEDKMSYFWATIGVDQAPHMLCLVYTYIFWVQN